MVRIHRIADAQVLTESTFKPTPRLIRFIEQGLVVIDDPGEPHVLVGPDYAHTLEAPDARDRVAAVMVSHEGKQLVTGSMDGSLTTWAAGKDRMSAANSLPLARIGPPSARLLGRAVISAMDRSLDGQTYAIAVLDNDDKTRNRIVVFSPAAPSNGFIIPTPGLRLPTPRFLDGGRTLCAVAADRVLRWDLSDQARAAPVQRFPRRS